MLFFFLETSYKITHETNSSYFLPRMTIIFWTLLLMRFKLVLAMSQKRGQWSLTNYGIGTRSTSCKSCEKIFNVFSALPFQLHIRYLFDAQIRSHKVTNKIVDLSYFRRFVVQRDVRITYTYFQPLADPAKDAKCTS